METEILKNRIDALHGLLDAQVAFTVMLISVLSDEQKKQLAHQAASGAEKVFVQNLNSTKSEIYQQNLQTAFDSLTIYVLQNQKP